MGTMLLGVSVILDRQSLIFAYEIDPDGVSVSMHVVDRLPSLQRYIGFVIKLVSGLAAICQ